MKKIAALLCALVLLGLFVLPSAASGGPPPHVWELNTFLNGGDERHALLLGEVIEITDAYFLIDVVRTVNGRRAQSPFRLRLLTSQYRTFDFFSLGDGILIAVKFEDNSVGVSWAMPRRVQLLSDGNIRIDPVLTRPYINSNNDLYIEEYVNNTMGTSVFRNTWYNALWMLGITTRMANWLGGFFGFIAICIIILIFIRRKHRA